MKWHAVDTLLESGDTLSADTPLRSCLDFLRPPPAPVASDFVSKIFLFNNWWLGLGIEQNTYHDTPPSIVNVWGDSSYYTVY